MSEFEALELRDNGTMESCCVKLFIATSLDGYIARTDDSVDWLFTDDDCGYSDFISSIDTLIMGRKTFIQIRNFIS